MFNYNPFTCLWSDVHTVLRVQHSVSDLILTAVNNYVVRFDGLLLDFFPFFSLFMSSLILEE